MARAEKLRGMQPKQKLLTERDGFVELEVPDLARWIDRWLKRPDIHERVRVEDLSDSDDSRH
jgi:hypothetical protein